MDKDFELDCRLLLYRTDLLEGELAERLTDLIPCGRDGMAACGKNGSDAVTAAVRVLAGLPVTAAPRMMVADMFSVCTAPGVDLLG